jgi:hypothetical protein
MLQLPFQLPSLYIRVRKMLILALQLQRKALTLSFQRPTIPEYD